MMRFIYITLFLLFVATAVTAQLTNSSTLAEATGIKITADDLSPEDRELFDRREIILASNRTKFLEQTIAEMLLEAEGKSRGISGEKVLEAVFEKLPKPSEAEIKAVYDANKGQIGDRPLSAVREQIVGFLMQEPNEKAESELINELKTKHKFVAGKDVNAKETRPTDTLFTMNGKPFTLFDFETKDRIALNDVEVHLYEEMLSGVEYAFLTKLMEKEAVEKKTDASSIFAAEITDKMKDFSDVERANLWYALLARLSAKYSGRILLPEPRKLVLSIPTDDEPFTGPANAPVTVVVFNDFQCSACAGFAPVVKRVSEEFTGKVRLVIKDFPLESIHENAFRAALAANAAHRQGKYFEYGNLLYSNQSSLDDASLLSYAVQLKLDANKFRADMSDPKNAEEIRADIAGGNSVGVGGTPTIFINGVKHHGLIEPKFRQALEKAVNAVK